MIVFDNVTKRYGAAARDSATVALANVTLSVPAGSVTAIVGPNGAGKSTMLGLVLGFLRQTAGSVTIAGSAPRAWVRRNGAGYLPERFAPPPEWRVDRTVRAFARLDGAARADARSTAREAIDRFGLGPHASKEVGSLSRGLLQRLGLAQATIAARGLVILDEPTEGLDPPGRALFRETLTELRAAGSTVLVASHDLAELERVADRAFVLDDGRLRESIELRLPADRRAWILSLASPLHAVIEIFPDAVVLDSPLREAQPVLPSLEFETDGDTSPGVRYAVTIEGARDLTARLARLIGAGALITGVAPASPSLEDRLRQALEREEIVDHGDDESAVTPTRDHEAP
jgi:ABC-type multidrug transport system ATPase subunit